MAVARVLLKFKICSNEKTEVRAVHIINVINCQVGVFEICKVETLMKPVMFKYHCRMARLRFT